MLLHNYMCLEAAVCTKKHSGSHELVHVCVCVHVTNWLIKKGYVTTELTMGN